jgi:hypothetical protein
VADKVGPTDMNPSDPHGVGDSTNRRGEDVIEDEGSEPGRHPNQGTKGASNRPYGGAETESSTGVNPQGTIDESMPDMTTGDQGG